MFITKYSKGNSSRPAYEVEIGDREAPYILQIVVEKLLDLDLLDMVEDLQFFIDEAWEVGIDGTKTTIL